MKLVFLDNLIIWQMLARTVVIETTLPFRASSLAFLSRSSYSASFANLSFICFLGAGRLLPIKPVNVS